MDNPLKTRQWQNLRRRVIKEEPTCRIQLPGCTRVSTQGDHIVPVSVNPQLALERSNIQGACGPCNSKRGSQPMNAVVTPRALAWFNQGA